MKNRNQGRAWRLPIFAVILVVCACTSGDELEDGAESLSSNEDQPIQGYLDIANASILAGWARDPDYLGPVAIHVYIDGKFHMQTVADRYRYDLPFNNKNHGFQIEMPPLGPGTHRVVVYGIGVDEEGRRVRQNRALANSPMYFTIEAPLAPGAGCTVSKTVVSGLRNTFTNHVVKLSTAAQTGCTNAIVKMWGAGGKDGYHSGLCALGSTAVLGNGGGGGYTSVEIDLDPNKDYWVKVPPDHVGYGGTAGASTVYSTPAGYLTPKTLVAVAGGGGVGGFIGLDPSVASYPDGGGAAQRGRKAAATLSFGGTEYNFVVDPGRAGNPGQPGALPATHGVAGVIAINANDDATVCTNHACVTGASTPFVGGRGGDGYGGGGASSALRYNTCNLMTGGSAGGTNHVVSTPDIVHSTTIDGTWERPGNPSDCDRYIEDSGSPCPDDLGRPADGDGGLAETELQRPGRAVILYGADPTATFCPIGEYWNEASASCTPCTNPENSQSVVYTSSGGSSNSCNFDSSTLVCEPNFTTYQTGGDACVLIDPNSCETLDACTSVICTVGTRMCPLRPICSDAYNFVPEEEYLVQDEDGHCTTEVRCASWSCP